MIVYSKSKDRAFCFCCKLFYLILQGGLNNNGINEWKHISQKIKSQEIIVSHYTSLNSWIEFKKRILELNTIDKLHLIKPKKEKQHWCDTITQILTVFHFLA